MSKQRINIGNSENTGTGDTLRSAMDKINNNFDEVYDILGQDSTGKSIDIAGNTISSTFTNTDINISPNGTGDTVIDSDLVVNTIKSDDSTEVTVSDGLNVNGTVTATAFVGDGSGITGLSASTGNIVFSESSITSSDSTQININENLNVDGILKIGDGSVSANYAGFGDADDLKIFHNGSHSIIRETGTGSLYIQSDNNVFIGKDTASETMIKAVADGAVELYHDNAKTFETTATGVIVGAADTNAEITTQGTGALTLSTNSGTNSGTIVIADGNNANITVDTAGNGDILLKTDGSAGRVGIGTVGNPDTALHIKSNASIITLQRTADANTPGLSFQNSNGNTRGAIKLDGTSGTSNEIFMETFDGASQVERFRVTHTGAKVTGKLEVDEIVGADSSAIQISNLDTNVISSSDSSQVTVEDGLTINGIVVMMSNLPTSDPNNAGQSYNDSGVLKISAG